MVTQGAETNVFLPWRKGAALVCLIFLISRLMVFGAAALASKYLPQKTISESLPPATIDRLVRNDAVWYLDVAKRGYIYENTPDGVANGTVVFYPVFPALIRAVTSLVGNAVVAGYLVSNLTFLTGLLLLWRLVVFEFKSTQAASWTVAFAAFCPGGAWFFMIFSEGSFFLLFVCTIFAVRWRKWGWAALAGYLLALTRTIGVLAGIFVLFEVFQLWKVRKEELRNLNWRQIRPEIAWQLLAIAAPAFGYITFLTFCQIQFGDWQAQHHVLVSNWPAAAHFTWPWAAIMREWAPMHASKRLIIYGLLGFGLFLSGLSYFVLRRGLSYPLVALGMISICVVLANHSPMARYLSVLVPVHMTLGMIAKDHPRLGMVALLCSAAAMAAITGLTVSGYVFY